MRKRKFLIGAVLGVTASLAVSGIASAAVIDQTYSSVAAKTKQDKKVRGNIGSFTTIVDTTYGGGTLAPSATCAPANQTGCTFFPPANQTVLDFDNAFKLGIQGKGKLKLARCNVADITGKDQAGAVAECGDAQVGQGSSIISQINGQQLNGIVSAFNGAPSGGANTIYLHVDIIGSTTSPILTGTLNGTVLTVQVPVTPGTVIDYFDTTINKVKVAKADKKRGIPAQYYLMAKCNDGSWDHTEQTFFTNGQVIGPKTFSQACQKKA